MQLQVSHQTSYFYQTMANRSVQYIRMSPQNCSHQKVNNWQLLLPVAAYYQSDGFGNIWTVLTRNEKHNNLQIQAQGIVEINTDTVNLPADNTNPYMYTVVTELTDCSEEMKDFAQTYLTSASVESLRKFAAAILEKIPYTSGSTFVDTTAIEAFDKQAGVCQDHSHIFIACLREFGIPARYVSGYLFSEGEGHLHSHAWAEAFIDGYWYTFDISNQLFTPCSHIYVAFGRDYNDAAPVKGMRQGGGVETMSSQVQVSIVD